ncbi:MAG: polysaccharide biosynthesis tyrosine autokinase [Deltaproteobacteria bacterium]|nr:polysaccharide biosynthesis tyrosine autokinase [Deltaproteobacteria bacterium]
MTTDVQNLSQRIKLDQSGGFFVDPKELLHAVNRRKWLIMFCAVTLGGAVAFGTMRQPKIYASAAEITVEPRLQEVMNENMTLDDIASQEKGAFLNTQYETIESRAVLRRVAAQLNLTKDEGFLRDHGLNPNDKERVLDAAADAISRALSVAPNKKSRIVRLTVEDRDPNRAARIANSIAQVYIDYSLERRLEDTRGASRWLDEQVEEYARRLERAEHALYDFKKDHSLVSVSLEDRKNITAASLQTLTQRLVQSQATLLELESKKRTLNELKADPDADILAAPRIAGNQSVASIRRDQNQLKEQLAGMMTRYGERHPDVEQLQQRLTEAEQHLSAEISLAMETLDSEIVAEKTLLTSLGSAIEAEKINAMELNGLGLEYSKLTRDFGTTKSLYQNLLKRQAEADLSAQLESNFVHWFERAEPRLQPVRPDVPQNTAFGAFLGLILGLMIAVGGVLLDNTVHGQTDVEAMGLPFLGIIPSINEEDQAPKTSEDRDLFIVRKPKSHVAECARSVRTNLLFMSTDRALGRLLVTSAGPSEGKSTTAIALAITMAQAGNRVLLVDTDLRRPRLHKTFGVKGESGLTNVLLKEATLEEAIKATDVVGLDVLPCGALPPNPAELLHGERFHEVKKEIENRYDRVIYDSPPVNAVTDSLILSQDVDGTVVVVKASATSKEFVRRAVRQLLDVKANVLGIVLNDLDFDNANYRYYNYYYYSRYSYGSDEKQAEV